MVLNETFNGIRTIKCSRREPLWIKRFDDTVNDRLQNYQRRNIWKTVPTFYGRVARSGVGAAGIVLRWSYASSFYSLIPLFTAPSGLRSCGRFPHEFAVLIKMDIVSALPSLSLISDLLQAEPDRIPEGKRVFERLDSAVVFNPGGLHS